MLKEADAPRGEASGTRSGYVALFGWTNVGKSTLLNRLVGVKLAAVAAAAQTTRQRIMGVRTIAGRGQIVFLDTPGLHRPRYALNQRMLQVARRGMEDADLVVLMIDAARGPGAGDREAADLLRRRERPRLAVLNKIDLVRPKSRLLPMIRRVSAEWEFDEVIPVSALTGDGCERLLEAMFGLLPEGGPLYPDDYLTDQPERLIAAEYVREGLLQETREELPHATAVVIERWQERDDGLLTIEAAILVDRETQRPIVVGAGGLRLKRVGQVAREELERFLGRRIYLRLWVRVRRDWRNDPRVLQELGIAGA